MSEIEIGGTLYQCNKISPARRQYHVMRRLLPAIGEFVNLFTAQQAGIEVPDGEWMGAVARAVPTLSDADSDYVLDNALAFVRFKSGDRWAPLTASNGSGLMLDALVDDLATQLRLVFEVLRESLENFSVERLLGSTPPNGLDMPMAAAA